MTVIAKLYVQDVLEFGTGTHVHLACVADNQTMAAYAEENEDKLFTRYSPWGEIRLQQRAGWAVFTKEEAYISTGKLRTFYAVMIPAEDVEGETFKGAAAFVKINCYSTSKFAQDGTRVELRDAYGWKGENTYDDRMSRRGVIERASWKMHVDNPPAEAQFVAGRDYWLAFYDTDQFDMQQALAAAHGLTPADPAA